MNVVLKKIIYFVFPVIKDYHEFLLSQTNKVTMSQYLKFRWGG